MYAATKMLAIREKNGTGVLKFSKLKLFIPTMGRVHWKRGSRLKMGARKMVKMAPSWTLNFTWRGMSGGWSFPNSKLKIFYFLEVPQSSEDRTQVTTTEATENCERDKQQFSTDADWCSLCSAHHSIMVFAFSFSVNQRLTWMTRCTVHWLTEPSTNRPTKLRSDKCAVCVFLRSLSLCGARCAFFCEKVPFLQYNTLFVGWFNECILMYLNSTACQHC